MMLSAVAARVLHLGLPVILLEMVIFTYMLRRELMLDPVYALHHYPFMLEHIMMGLTLIVIGAFLFDCIARRKKN